MSCVSTFGDSIVRVRSSVVLFFAVALCAFLSRPVSAQSIPGGSGGGTAGGGPNPSFVIVDYDSAGGLRAAYIAGLPAITGPSTAQDLELALSISMPIAEANAALYLVHNDVSLSAAATKQFLQGNGRGSEEVFAVISLSPGNFGDFDTGAVEAATSASQFADFMEGTFLADGFATSRALSAVGALMLHKTGTKPGNKIGSVFKQQYIYVETADGDIYYPKDGDGLVDVLNDIESDGDTVKHLVIKGHGSPEMIEVGSGGDILTTGGSRVIIGNINDPNDSTDITDVLNNVTDGGTDIELRGCWTSQLASDVNDALGGDPDVSGSITPVVGIPWGPFTVGPYYTY